jgi:hypothetical protein
MVTGALLFAVVSHFVLRPTMATAGNLPPLVLRSLLGLALGACALSLLLRRRIPQRSSDVSSDLYWMTAAGPALMTWAPLELASLLAVVLYARTGAPSAIAVAGIAVALFVVLNPAHFERR